MENFLRGISLLSPVVFPTFFLLEDTAEQFARRIYYVSRDLWPRQAQTFIFISPFWLTLSDPPFCRGRKCHLNGLPINFRLGNGSEREDLLGRHPLDCSHFVRICQENITTQGWWWQLIVTDRHSMTSINKEWIKKNVWKSRPEGKLRTKNFSIKRWMNSIYFILYIYIFFLKLYDPERKIGRP